MKIKHITTLFLVNFVSLWNLQAQESVLADSVFNPNPTDTIINVRNEADEMLGKLLQDWVMTYVQEDDCDTTGYLPSYPDSVYVERLRNLPHVMEMPYNDKVRAFMDMYVVKRRQQLATLLGLSDYYFPIFEEALNRYNLPLELKYLPIIESALKPTIVSHAGAAGLWQFIVSTGRMYGLEINSLIDERCDPIKATDAACRYLRDLYAIYGDWHLVIAAYNCGPGNVNKAIRRSGGKRDYWAIYPYLPRETRGYVPIFIAANYAMNYHCEHNICKQKVNMPIITDTIMTGERMHLEQLAYVLQMPIEELRMLNPQYRRDVIPGNGKQYSICLPAPYAELFIDKESEILAYKADELINNRRAEINMAQQSAHAYGNGVIYYKVKSGNTLGGIAQKYRVSVSQLKKWNNIKGTTIRVGQTLKIYR